jgi:hypothetical protein
MASYVARLHWGMRTIRPKARYFLGLLARTTGVNTMSPLQVFHDMLMLESHMHRATIPSARMYFDFGIVVT